MRQKCSWIYNIKFIKQQKILDMSQIQTKNDENLKKIKKQEQTIKNLEQQIRQRCQSYLIQINKLKKKQESHDSLTLVSVYNLQLETKANQRMTEEYQNQILQLEKQSSFPEEPNNQNHDFHKNLIDSFKQRIMIIQKSKNTAIKDLKQLTLKCIEHEEEIKRLKNQEYPELKSSLKLNQSKLSTSSHSQQALKIIQSQLSSIFDIQIRNNQFSDPLSRANFIVQKVKDFRKKQKQNNTFLQTEKYHQPIEQNVVYIKQPLNDTVSMQGQFNTLIRQVDMLKAQNSRLQGELQIARREFDSLKVQYRKRQQEIQEISKFKKQNEIIRQQKIKIQKQVQQNIKQNEIVKNQRTEQINILKTRLQDCGKEIEGLKSMLENTNTLSHQDKSIEQDNNKQIKELKNTIINLKGQNQKIAKNLAEKEKNFLILDVQNKFLREERNNNNDQIERINQTLKNTHVQVQNLKTCKLKYEDQISRLVLQLQSKKQNQGNVQVQNFSDLSKINQYIQKNINLQEENKRLKQQIQVTFAKNNQTQPCIIQEDLQIQNGNDYVKRRFIKKTVIRRNLSAISFKSVSKDRKQTITQLQNKIDTMKKNGQPPLNSIEKHNVQKFQRKISNLKKQLENEAIKEVTEQSQANRQSGSVSSQSNDGRINIVELKTEIPVKSIYNAKIFESKSSTNVDRTNRLYNFNKNDKKTGSGNL